MAKTRAPLLSFGAAGQIGETAVFATWRGRKYAREYVVPANPRTQAQTVTRATFALLRGMWKIMPSLGLAPWNLYAQGRPFMGLNAFVGENMRVVRGDPLMTDFIGSPGAKGGISPESAVAAAGGTGEIDVTITSPTPPPDWTLEAEQGITFLDQDPASPMFSGQITAAENDPATGTLTFTGLDTGESYIVSVWLKWTKPDGGTAYSVSITDTAVAG